MLSHIRKGVFPQTISFVTLWDGLFLMLVISFEALESA